MSKVFTALIVEDEERIRKGLRKLMEEHVGGFQVIAEGCNGKEGLELFEKYLPDIVVTDVRMPRMDGLEMLQRIRNKQSNVPVIILSGHDEFEYVRKALRSSVVDYLLKPIDHTEFARALQKARTTLSALDTVSDTQKETELSEGEANRIIRRIKELIQQNLDKEFTLQNVSEEIKLNYNYLSSLFKEKIGMNFTDFLTEARMKKALILLKNSTMKTYEIAELCGYSNSKYFSTVFKKNKGKTPAEYRQST